MSRLAHFGCAVIAALCISGCTQYLVKNGAPVPVIMAEVDILTYAQRFGELSPEAQKKELAQATQAVSRNRNDTKSRMKVALIYSLPASRHRDNERALALLEELQRDVIHADSNTRALASVLKDYVLERQRLENSAAKTGQKAAEEQKRADAEQKRADTEQKRADDLQLKLDELKNIEKAISERYQTRPR
jgi:hypothetical protein